jgi:hypothetical protein
VHAIEKIECERDRYQAEQDGEAQEAGHHQGTIRGDR